MRCNRPLIDKLFELHDSAKSGLFRIQKESARKQLVLKQGTLAFAESCLPEEHLARIAVLKNLLPRAAVPEVASLMETGKTSEEAILKISNGDERILEQARREQAIAILASMLKWADCEMHFYPGENLVRYRLSLDLALPEILVLSARRAASDALAAIPPDFYQRAFSIPQNASRDAANLPLDNAEYYCFSLAGEKMQIGDLLNLFPAGTVKPEELLLRLAFLGLIEPEAALEVKAGHMPAAADETDSAIQNLEAMLQQFEAADPYKILGVATDASAEEIQGAYHELARQYHPDRYQSRQFSAEVRAKAEQVFTYINESYGTLRNPSSRALYDDNRRKNESPIEKRSSSGTAAGPADRDQAEVIFREGRACLARGDFEKAIEHLKNCVWLSPGNARYHRYLGVAQSESPKHRKSAEQHLLKSSELEPFSIESRLALAKLYLKVSLPRKAEVQLREVLGLDPENREARRLSEELKKPDKTSTRRIGNFFSH